ncbi:MAG: nicotinate-nucleotide adenylyltransferase [Parvularculaceae bacterium]
MIPQRHDHSAVGLLGGSFNPAHGGHREISLLALKRLQLDAVWWLVTPANPLKEMGAYAPYEERLKQARRMADHPRIVVSNFEERKGLQYTVDTILMLQELWPQMRFVWLMGADGFATFDQWKDWRRIFSLLPIAVFARPGYEAAAAESEAAREFSAFRADDAEALSLARAEPPAWTLFSETANPASSTELRRSASKSPRPT